MRHGFHVTPVGTYAIVIDDGAALVRLERLEGGAKSFTVPAEWGERDDGAVAFVASQLDEYFAGTRRTFDVKLAPSGTEFQRSVWDGLKKIRFGKTTSYGELAEKIGKPGAARAVGNAAGNNPIPIIIPCHRLLAAHGKIGGYSGGEGVKEKLLDLEGIAY